MKHALLLVGLATLAARPSAQVGPTLLTTPAGSTTFDANTNPVLSAIATRIHTAAFFKLNNNMAGEWTVGITTSRGTDTDVHVARWSPNHGGTPSLVLTNEAAACNSSNDEYLFQIEPTRGLHAVFDRFGGGFQGVFLASRSAPGTPFGVPVRIQALRDTNGWADASIGFVGGQLMLFYGGTGTHPNGTRQPAILMAPIDLSNPAAPQAGTPIPVAFSVSGRVPHSPSPVVGPDGDVEGMFLAEVNFSSGDSDTYFADDLDALTPHMIAFDTPGWLNGGGIAGGYMATGDSSVGYARLREARGAWLIGDADPMITGGTQVDVRSGSPHAGGGAANVTFVFMSTALSSAPIPAPAGILGFVGLSGAIFPLATMIPTIAADEEASWSAQLAYQPALVGVVLPLQAVALQPSTGVALMTNTAKIAL